MSMLNSTMSPRGSALCLNCGEKPTIEAHLLPRAFAKDARNGGRDLKVGFIDKAGFKYSKSGVFDSEILCACCDGKLNKFDNYAIEFCREFEARRKRIGEDMFQIGPVDTDLLVKFMTSVVWRFSISKRPEATQINLGPFEAKFQNLIFSSEPAPKDLSLVIMANQSVLNLKKLVRLPTMHKHFERNFCSMTVGGLNFVLKIDRRPLPSKLQMLCVNGKTEFIGAYRPFDGSPEFHELLQVASNMRKPKAKHPGYKRKT